MLIRLLEATDSITALTRMLHAAYARLREMGFNYTAVDQSDDVTRKRIAGGECLVAVDGATLAGTVMVYAPGGADDCAFYRRPCVATIGQFGVSPSLQGRGVGGLLLAEAERRALLAGAAELALDTSEGADHLIAWYARHGFRVVDRVQWRGKTYRSVIMSKSLVAPAPQGSG